MADHPWVSQQKFATIFVGGGTPTIYDGQRLARLIRQCLSRFQFAAAPEISIETNPNTVSFPDLAAIREAGVNRLSIGVQSFADHLLATIGRSHSRATAVAAITAARRAGFANINLDFMYGLPGQTVADWRQTLEMALNFAPEHLALYELTIEPGTPFAAMEAKGELLLPDHDQLADMEELAVSQLAAAGYRRYEISNFSRPGRECRHNSNYWRNGSYLGLGAGGVSCFDGLRLRNVDDFCQYEKLVAGDIMPVADGEALSLAAGFRESVVMGLRMRDGVSIRDLQARYGIEAKGYYGEILVGFVATDMLSVEGDRLRLTDKAFPLANQVLAELV